MPAIGGWARLRRAGLPEGIVSPTFDAAIRPQSAAMIGAYGNRFEGARMRRIIDSARSPAPYGAVVPQRTRRAFAAVYGLATTGRRAVRAASPRSIGLGRLFVHPAPGGAVGLLLAGLDFAPRNAPPAPDFPVRPEPAGMEGPGVDDGDRRPQVGAAGGPEASGPASHFASYDKGFSYAAAAAPPWSRPPYSLEFTPRTDTPRSIVAHRTRDGPDGCRGLIGRRSSVGHGPAAAEKRGPRKPSAESMAYAAAMRGSERPSAAGPHAATPTRGFGNLAKGS